MLTVRRSAWQLKTLMRLTPDGAGVGVGVGFGSGAVRPHTVEVLAETPKRFSAWIKKQYCLSASRSLNVKEVVFAPSVALGLLSPDSAWLMKNRRSLSLLSSH